MNNEMKQLILEEIEEHFFSGEQDLTIAFNRASYAFACYGDEDNERCQEIFGVDSDLVYDAQFEIDDIKLSEVLDYLEVSERGEFDRFAQ